VTPEGTPEIACTLQGIPADLGFLQNGEAVVTDMHRRSLVRCAGGQAIDHADLSNLTSTLDDKIVDEIGRAYVGDLGFDLKSGIKNGPYGRIILVEPDGRILDRISVPGRRVVACALGGDDRKTLFCVSMDPDRGTETGSKSQSYVDAAVVEVPGAGYP
jgi:sugar lactone lactonase YvrE